MANDNLRQASTSVKNLAPYSHVKMESYLKRNIDLQCRGFDMLRLKRYHVFLQMQEDKMMRWQETAVRYDL